MAKVVNFRDFLRPNKEIKDFSRRLLKFKTFSILYKPWYISNIFLHTVSIVIAKERRGVLIENVHIHQQLEAQ